MSESSGKIDISEKYALYTILGLDPPINDATQNVDANETSNQCMTHEEFQALLKRKYRRAALKHHPDSGGLEENFQFVSIAHDILLDENSKRWYDEDQDYVYTAEGYSEYLEFQRFQSQLRSHFSNSLEDINIVNNAFLNKILNIAWKFIQIGILLAFFLLTLFMDVYWISDRRIIHYFIGIISSIGAYWYWGRILSCWCIKCWCFAPWTFGLLTPILFHFRRNIKDIVFFYIHSEIFGRWKMNLIAILCLEFILHFFYGCSWTRALVVGSLLVWFFPLLILLFGAATVLGKLMRIPILFSAVFCITIFLLDIFVLHWFPIGYTYKLFIFAWMTLFVLSSEMSSEEGSSNVEQEKEEENEDSKHEA